MYEFSYVQFILCCIVLFCVCEEPYRKGEQCHSITVILTCRVRIRHKLLPESDNEQINQLIFYIII
jgi:hypothetical protein